MFECLFLALSLSAHAGLASTSVGQVKDHVLTSREVQLHSYLVNALAEAKSSSRRQTAPPVDVDSKAFGDQATATLMDKAIAMEAKNFQAVPLERKELAVAFERFYRSFKANEEMRRNQYSEREFREMLQTVLQARKFISFKAESSTVPITDVEARNYFEQNRGRFGQLPYENFQETIKGFLAKSHVESRLRDWFEGLQNKYQVRNFLSDI